MTAIVPCRAYTCAMSEVGQVIEEERNPEEEAIRLAALSQIRQYPDPVLKMAAREVDSFDEDLRRLVDRMKRLMKDACGVGLAGNQVGMLRRLFVFQKDEDEVAALVNPRIVGRSDETDVLEEGCLSIQGVRVPVERSWPSRSRPGTRRAETSGSSSKASRRESPSTRSTTWTAR